MAYPVVYNSIGSHISIGLFSIWCFAFTDLGYTGLFPFSNTSGTLNSFERAKAKKRFPHFLYAIHDYQAVLLFNIPINNDYLFRQ